MSEDSFKKRAKAQEEQYFEKQNAALMAKLQIKDNEGNRPSPITGKPMETVELMGVTIDRCLDSKGIWLDAGELEQLIQAFKAQDEQEKENWISDFFGTLFASKG